MLFSFPALFHSLLFYYPLSKSPSSSLRQVRMDVIISFPACFPLGAAQGESAGKDWERASAQLFSVNRDEEPWSSFPLSFVGEG